MRISIITVVLNNVRTIEHTISSVLNQTYPNVEYIVVDGGSTDGTKAIIQKYRSKIARYIGEPDRGMYHAMNKGIAVATGEIIGILNADDFYTSNDVLRAVAGEFAKNNIDCLFADVRFVRETDLNRTIRYMSGRMFRPPMLRFGFMPPHPTFFVKKSVLDGCGRYRVDYEIAADYELMVRLLYLHAIRYKYLPLDMIKMRVGGKSTRSIVSTYTLNKEIVRSCRENGLYTNMFILLFKYFVKMFELINRRNSPSSETRIAIDRSDG